MRSFWAVLGGSIVAGFGLAFGRDIYKEVKRNWAIIVAILVALSLLIGLFYSCIFLVRRYETLGWRIVGRAGGVILFVVCYFGLLFILAIAEISDPQSPQADTLADILAQAHFVDPGSPHNLLFIFQNLIVIAGILVGVRSGYLE